MHSGVSIFICNWDCTFNITLKLRMANSLNRARDSQLYLKCPSITEKPLSAFDEHNLML